VRLYVQKRDGWPSPYLLQVLLGGHRSLLQVARLTSILCVRKRVVAAARLRNRVIDVGSVGCRRLRPNCSLAAEDTRVTALGTRSIPYGLWKYFASTWPSGGPNLGRTVCYSPRFEGCRHSLDGANYPTGERPREQRNRIKEPWALQRSLIGALGTLGPVIRLRTQSERVRVVDRIAAPKPVQVHSTRQPDRVLLRKPPGCRVVIPVPHVHLARRIQLAL
jgi:hypothetical protein